jgi:hypothetical protein
VHPDDAVELAAAVHGLADRASTPPLVVRCRHRDGDWRHVELVSRTGCWTRTSRASW